MRMLTLASPEADEKKPGVGTGKTRKTPAVMPAPKKVKHEAFLELAGTLQMSKIKPRDSGPAPNGDITPVDKTQVLPCALGVQVPTH